MIYNGIACNFHNECFIAETLIVQLFFVTQGEHTVHIWNEMSMLLFSNCDLVLETIDIRTFFNTYFIASFFDQ